MSDPVPHPLRLLVVDEASAPGGIERVTLGLLPELARQCAGLVWLLPEHRIPALRAALPPDSGIHIESLHRPARRAERLLHQLARKSGRMLGHHGTDHWLEELRVRAVLREHRCTHLFYPALFRQPFPAVRVPVWAVVHDVNYHPSWHAECLANLRDWRDRAAGFIAISRFTRDEMGAVDPVFLKRTVAVPNASELPAAKQPATAASDRTGPPELLYPAGLNPHKGHAQLLEALRLLHARGTDFRLTLTGAGTERLLSASRLGQPEIERARRVLAEAPESFRERVHARGMVSTEALETCFQKADLVVLPSRYEGYGLPLAEAVGRGRRVLCSDIPAFREQVLLYGLDDAVDFVSGGHPEDWAHALEETLAAATPSPYSPEEIRTRFDRWTWRHAAGACLRALSGRTSPETSPLAPCTSLSTT